MEKLFLSNYFTGFLYQIDFIFKSRLWIPLSKAEVLNLFENVGKKEYFPKMLEKRRFSQNMKRTTEIKCVKK